MKNKWSIILVSSLILLLSLSACGAVGEIKEVSATGNAFMETLGAGDAESSWNMLAPAVQDEVGNIETWADWISLRQFSDWRFSNTEITGNEAQMDGTGTVDGIDYTVTLVLDRVDDGWKISGINIE